MDDCQMTLEKSINIQKIKKKTQPSVFPHISTTNRKEISDYY